MSVDREYTIHIATVADTAGADQIAATLKSVGESGEKAGEDLNTFNFQGRQMQKLLDELDDKLPGTGSLLRAAFDPAQLGVSEVVPAIKLITTAFELWNKRVEEGTKALAGMRLPDLSEHIARIDQAAARKINVDTGEADAQNIGDAKAQADVLSKSIPEEVDSNSAKTLVDLGVVGNPNAVKDIVAKQGDSLSALVSALKWQPQIVTNIEQMIRLHENTAGVIAAMESRIKKLTRDLERHDRPQT